MPHNDFAKFAEPEPANTLWGMNGTARGAQITHAGGNKGELCWHSCKRRLEKEKRQPPRALSFFDSPKSPTLIARSDDKKMFPAALAKRACNAGVCSKRRILKVELKDTLKSLMHSTA